MATIKDFKTEVRNLVQQAMAQDKVEQKTIEEAMIWMIANFQAEDYFNTITAKDMASMLIEGIAKIDQKAVDNYLESMYDMMADQMTEEEQIEFWTCFTKRVEDFWFV